jgi:hypothetical protein
MTEVFTRIRGWRWLRRLLLATALVVGISACGAKVPTTPPANQGQNQPLVWDSGKWDNNQWN